MPELRHLGSLADGRASEATQDECFRTRAGRHGLAVGKGLESLVLLCAKPEANHDGSLGNHAEGARALFDCRQLPSHLVSIIDTSSPKYRATWSAFTPGAVPLLPAFLPQCPHVRHEHLRDALLLLLREQIQFRANRLSCDVPVEAPLQQGEVRQKGLGGTSFAVQNHVYLRPRLSGYLGKLRLGATKTLEDSPRLDGYLIVETPLWRFLGSLRTHVSLIDAESSLADKSGSTSGGSVPQHVHLRFREW